MTETAPQLTRPKKRPAAGKRPQAEAKKRPQEEKEKKATEERSVRRRQTEPVPVIREGEQRGLSLEREIRIADEENRRQRAAREKLRRAEAAREVLPEERREDKKSTPTHTRRCRSRQRRRKK